MRVKDCMSGHPEFLPPTATIKDAADFMLHHDCGFVPVGLNDKLIGAVTDRDIVIRAIAKGKDPNKTKLQDVLTEKIQFCFEGDDLKQVAQKMEEMQIRRLVVLDNDKSKRMTGILSFADIATKSDDKALSSELLEAVSQE